MSVVPPDTSELRLTDVILGQGRRACVKLGVDDGNLVAVKQFYSEYSTRCPDEISQEMEDFAQVT